MNILYILNIINDIYEHELFPKVLTISIILLIIMFVLVLLIGLRDARKAKEPKKEVEEDIKDITFDDVTDIENIKEDVTFEMPNLTKNLEDFKKNLEEEIQKESEIDVEKQNETEPEEEKPTKILDINEISDTTIIPVLNTDEDKSNRKEKDKKSEK